jgi:hypothetical protein
MFAQQSTIRDSIRRSEDMVRALEMRTIETYNGDSGHDMNINRRYMLTLERRVLATLQQVYTERGGKL